MRRKNETNLFCTLVFAHRCGGNGVCVNHLWFRAGSTRARDHRVQGSQHAALAQGIFKRSALDNERERDKRRDRGGEERRAKQTRGSSRPGNEFAAHLEVKSSVKFQDPFPGKVGARRHTDFSSKPHPQSCDGFASQVSGFS